MASHSPTLISDTPILVSGFLSSIFKIKSLSSSLTSGLGRGKEGDKDGTIEEGSPSPLLGNRNKPNHFPQMEGQEATHLLWPLQGIGPPTVTRKAEVGPSRGKCLVGFSYLPQEWAGASTVPPWTTHFSGNTTASVLIFLCRARM